MSVHRLEHIPGFSIDRVAAAAGNDPDVLRLENLDTDIPPPRDAVEVTRNAVGTDEANSYLPFTGTDDLRMAVATHLRHLSGQSYDPQAEVVITCGGTEGMLDALFAVVNPGDEVILTDPTYAGMTNRVRLVAAIPRLIPFTYMNNAWRLDLDALNSAVNKRTRALFIMNPSMPSGAVLNAEEWNAITHACAKNSLWLLYNAAMERILFDDLPYLHPASLPGMAERTLTIGSVSKEYRMIGWRIGWVTGPASVMGEVAKAHIYNAVTPPGISQAGARAALSSPATDLKACVAEWQQRRDAVLDQLKSFRPMTPSGGWSMLLDVSVLGFDSFTASKLLLERGRVAATPMRDWGEVNGDRFVRLVFSNEPVERLATLGPRVSRALG